MRLQLKASSGVLMNEGLDLLPLVRDIKAIVFDLDGTLIDCTQEFVLALNNMLDDIELPHIDAQFVRITIGKGAEYLIREALKYVTNTRAVDTVVEQQAMRRYLYHYSKVNGLKTRIFPSVKPTLTTLQEQGYKLACLTNKPSSLTGPLLVDKGLAHFFTCVFGGDAFIRKKPDPLPLLRTCEALGCQPQYVLMVGDSINDAKAARSASCPVALMRYGFNHGQPVDEVDADYHLNTLSELPKLIRKI